MTGASYNCLDVAFCSIGNILYDLLLFSLPGRRHFRRAQAYAQTLVERGVLHAHEGAVGLVCGRDGLGTLVGAQTIPSVCISRTTVAGVS